MNRGEKMIKAYAKSDVGKVREMNQDYYYISNSLDEVQLYILADGMGGYNGGEIASKIAVETAKNYIENNFKEIEKDRDSIIQLLGSSMEYANMVVYEKSQQKPELYGMGTTLEICLIYNNKVYIGHIGDSRIYRIRKEFIRKLTQDHSYVQKLVKEGKIERVATLKEYRGQHYGAAAITAAEEWFAERGVKKIFINSRTEAVGFYEKLGYVADPKQITGIGAFQCIMTEKQL